MKRNVHEFRAWWRADWWSKIAHVIVDDSVNWSYKQPVCGTKTKFAFLGGLPERNHRRCKTCEKIVDRLGFRQIDRP